MEGMPGLGQYPILQFFGGLMILFVGMMLWKKSERQTSERPSTDTLLNVTVQMQAVKTEIEENLRVAKTRLYERADELGERVGGLELRVSVHDEKWVHNDRRLEAIEKRRQA